MSEATSEVEALRARLSRLEALVQAARLLNSTLSVEVVLERMLLLARTLLSAERSSLFLVDAERQELWSKVASDLGGMREIRMPLGAGIAGQVARSGQVLRVEDAYTLPCFNPEVDRRTGYRTRSVLCVPMRDAEGAVMGVVEVLNGRDGRFDEADADFLQSLSDQAAIAIQNSLLHAELLARQKEEQDMRTAADVQRVMLAGAPPRVAGLDTAALCRPARSVGGDYYEVAEAGDEHLLLAVGDVSGKGCPSALLMASLLGGLRLLAGQEPSPAAILSCLNERLMERPVGGLLSTLFVASYHGPTRRLRFSNAGHAPALLVRAGTRDVERLDRGGLVLGVLEDQDYEEGEALLRPSDVLLLYSDGFPDARDDAGRRLGTEGAVEALVEAVRCGGDSADGVLAGLQDAIRRVTRDAPQADDLTLLVARCR